MKETGIELNGKNVLVVGIAKSGVAAARLLKTKGANVTLNDIKTEDKLKDILASIDFEAQLKLGVPADNFVASSDLIVVSPGVPIDLPFFNIAEEKNVKIIGEVELAYNFCKAPIIAITGTNGKTTTTTLIGEMFKDAGKDSYVVGNVGLPICSQIDNINEKSIIALEASSFQLETIDKFKPKVSLILNFTPDHLNRHKTFENYIKAKCRIFENQTEEDFVVLNYNDEGVKQIEKEVKAQIYCFSKYNDIQRGAFVSEGKIYVRDNGTDTYIMEVDKIYIPGEHNLENALSAVCAGWIMGLSPEQIQYTLENFKGVEHRIEFVCEVNGVRYINDSKGTNVDASVMAIRAMKTPTILIAGGYDKGGTFDEFIKEFGDKIKHLILMGVTADKIEKTALNYGFNSISRVNSMKEAVELASNIANSGDSVLLSPACASWDMFDNFEQRGEIFKNEVKNLRA